MSIHENIKSFFENEKDIVAVYLFGSHAEGRERLDSKKLAYFKMMALSKIASFHYYRSQMQSGIIRKVLEGA